jgi:hypothetical protein
MADEIEPQGRKALTSGSQTAALPVAMAPGRQPPHGVASRPVVPLRNRLAITAGNPVTPTAPNRRTSPRMGRQRCTRSSLDSPFPLFGKTRRPPLAWAQPSHGLSFEGTDRQPLK